MWQWGCKRAPNWYWWKKAIESWGGSSGGQSSLCILWTRCALLWTWSLLQMAWFMLECEEEREAKYLQPHRRKRKRERETRTGIHMESEVLNTAVKVTAMIDLQVVSCPIDWLSKPKALPSWAYDLICNKTLSTSWLNHTTIALLVYLFLWCMLPFSCTIWMGKSELLSPRGPLLHWLTFSPHSFTSLCFSVHSRFIRASASPCGHFLTQVNVWPVNTTSRAVDKCTLYSQPPLLHLYISGELTVCVCEYPVIKVNVSHKRPTMQAKMRGERVGVKKKKKKHRLRRFAFWITCHLNNDQSTREDERRKK